MTRLGKTGLGVVVAIVVLGVGLAAFIATFDWNRLKPVINDKVSSELRRPFAIRGDLSVAWVRHPEESGWRRWAAMAAGDGPGCDAGESTEHSR
jgi:uncharacterized protein involved in outer membrane biogenesis